MASFSESTRFISRIFYSEEDRVRTGFYVLFLVVFVGLYSIFDNLSDEFYDVYWKGTICFFLSKLYEIISVGVGLEIFSRYFSEERERRKLAGVVKDMIKDDITSLEGSIVTYSKIADVKYDRIQSGLAVNNGFLELVRDNIASLSRVSMIGSDVEYELFIKKFLVGKTYLIYVGDILPILKLINSYPDILDINMFLYCNYSPERRNEFAGLKSALDNSRNPERSNKILLKCAIGMYGTSLLVSYNSDEDASSFAGLIGFPSISTSVHNGSQYRLDSSVSKKIKEVVQRMMASGNASGMLMDSDAIEDFASLSDFYYRITDEIKRFSNGNYLTGLDNVIRELRALKDRISGPIYAVSVLNNFTLDLMTSSTRAGNLRRWYMDTSTSNGVSGGRILIVKMSDFVGRQQRVNAAKELIKNGLDGGFFTRIVDYDSCPPGKISDFCIFEDRAVVYLDQGGGACCFKC